MAGRETHRIPTLDGLRAVSIFLVILDHMAGTRGSPITRLEIGFFDIGFLGVRVFFVISGFLITQILLRELERKGTISLAHFYFRRTLRIFPPYYVYLGVVAMLSGLGLVTLNHGDLLYAATYTSNYNYPDRAWVVNHTWSLAVEEQFYLLWPAILVFTGRRGALVIAGAFVVASPIIRFLLFQYVPSRPIGDTFETVADAIAVGCLLAGTRELFWQKDGYRKFLRSRLFIFVPLAVFLLSALNGRPRTSYVLGYTGMNVGIALVIDRCIRFPTGVVGTFLDWRPVAFFGVMSYSVYLWQQLFLNRSISAWPTTFPANIVLSIGAAFLSYFLVERPALRLREWLENRWKRGNGG